MIVSPRIAALCLLVGIVPARVLANTWCSTNFPNAVFCEDFDRYCFPVPPYPQECSVGSVMGWADFLDAWVPTGDITGFCGSTLGLDTDFTSSLPWSAKMNTQQHGDFGYSVNAISEEVRNTFGQVYSSVLGTELHPLVLELVLNGQSNAKGKYDNTFMSLVSGSSFAPTDWAYSDWCGCLPPPLHRWPVICQQESPVAGCPPIASAPAVSAIAVGFLAYLDSNPCHCGEPGDQSPYNEHLSFFDGHKWYKLRQGLFPGSGDFRVRANENKIKVTIKTSSLKVELTCPSNSEYSWCQIPNGYAGPFSALATGFHKACRLEFNEWTCKEDRTCEVTVGVPNGGVARYDNIALHGGTGYVLPGACCFPDTHCEEGAIPGDCATLGGQFAGSGTICANTACCPPQPGDHDLDGDVDMVDFGWFQKCLSGTDIPVANVPCECADLDDDGDADSSDVTTFIGCMLGPDIAANPACAN